MTTDSIAGSPQPAKNGKHKGYAETLKSVKVWTPLRAEINEPNTAGKKAYGSKWQERPKSFDRIPHGENYGLLVEFAGLVDIDLDSDEARYCFPQFCPTDTLSIGRGGKTSHYLYAGAAENDTLVDFTKEQGDKDRTLLEIRHRGKQVMWAGSTHPSGQAVTVTQDIDPMPMPTPHSIRLAQLATLIARLLPDKGRHDISLPLAGHLKSRGLPEHEAIEVVEAAWAFNDGNVTEAVRNVETTYAHENPTRGGKLEEVLPGARKAIDRIFGWKPGGVEQNELRDQVLDSANLASTGLGWRRYEAGVWVEQAEQQVRSLVQDVIEGAEGVRFTNGLVTSVTTLVDDKTYVAPGAWDSNRDIVVLRDHVLDLDTGTTREHSPQDYATSKLPFNYDPEARAPRWDSFLQDRFPDASVRALLQEYVGYALTTDNSLETALWFVGEGGTGKSTFIETVTHIMGDRGGTLDIGDLGQRFGLAGIPGKTLLTATEQPGDYLKQLNVLNKLISGEKLRIEDKNVRGEDVEPVCKILWAMNDLPAVRSPENGIWRRLKIVRFPAANHAPDPTLKATLKAEAAGILAWAVDGLMRLRERGKFEIPEAVESATSEYQHENDLERQFIEERCRVDLFNPDLNVSSEHLYGAYRRWCERFGYKPKTKQTVAKEWKRLGLEKYKNSGIRYRGLEVLDYGRDMLTFEEGARFYSDESGEIFKGSA